MNHSHKLWLGIALFLVPFLAAPAAQPPQAEPEEMERQDPLTGEITRLVEDLDPQTDSELEVDEGENRLSPVEREQFRRQALAAFSLADAEVQQIPARKLEERTVPIRLGSDDFVMRLSPYSMRTEDFQVLVPDSTGALVPTEPPEPATYRGSLIGQPSAKVAASILDGKLLAMIVTDTQTWTVQPLAASVPGAPDDLHVVYRASDVIGEQGTCGVDDHMAPIQPGGHQGTESGSNDGDPRGLIQGRTEIAFDADFEFYQANGSSVDLTVQDIEMIMNQVGLIYQNQVDICYALTGVIVWSSEPDPYNATDDGTLLCEFTDFWNSVVQIQRDVAHLMTGKDVTSVAAGSGAVGVAWPGVVCNAVFTNCNGGILHYGLSESRFSTNLTSRTILTAHELGHNWNACHCNQSGCTSGSADTDCGVMWSNVGSASTTFGDRALTAITNHRDSRTCLDTCWDPTYVDWNNPFQGTGSSANPFHTVDEGVSYVPVGGTVIISVGTYPENLTINKTMTVTATGGVVTIGQ